MVSFEIAYSVAKCSSEQPEHPAAVLADGGKWAPQHAGGSASVDLSFGTEFSIHSVSFSASGCASVRILLLKKHGERGSWFAATPVPQEFALPGGAIECYDGKLPTSSECRQHLQCRSSGAVRLSALASSGSWVGLRIVLTPAPNATAETFYLRRLEVNRQPTALENEQIKAARADTLGSAPPDGSSSSSTPLPRPPPSSLPPRVPLSAAVARAPVGRAPVAGASLPRAPPPPVSGAPRQPASIGNMASAARGGQAIGRPPPHLAPRAQRPSQQQQQKQPPPPPPPQRRNTQPVAAAKPRAPPPPLPTRTRPEPAIVSPPTAATTPLCTPTASAAAEPPLCEKHGRLARDAFVKKAGKHFGKPVWVCALPPPHGCGFVAWRARTEDRTPASISSRGSSSSANPPPPSATARIATASSSLPRELGTPSELADPPLATPPTASTLTAGASARGTDGDSPLSANATARAPTARPNLAGGRAVSRAPSGWRKRPRDEPYPAQPARSSRSTSAAPRRKSPLASDGYAALGSTAPYEAAEPAVRTPVYGWDFDAELEGHDEDDEEEDDEHDEGIDEEVEEEEAMEAEAAAVATDEEEAAIPTPRLAPSTTSRLELMNASGDGEGHGDEEVLPLVIELIGASVLLGRGEAADVRVDSARLPRMVSREHAELVLDRDGRGWRVHDLGGTHNASRHNGTAVNGVPLEMGGSVLLHEGDVVRLGRKQSEVCYQLVSWAAPDDEGNSGSSPRL